MSVKYEPVIWNRAKYVYDLVLILAVGLYIYLFLNAHALFGLEGLRVDGQTQRMRAFGTCAFLMLSVILMIGPLARLDPRFLPLLYNRRHFGVLTCAVAAAHITYVLGWYFERFSPRNPIDDQWEALLISNVSFGQVLGFPFELLGLAAFAILVLLAVTSHDFWMSFLTPPVWKALHMLIYLAYAAVVAHIALGYLQDARDPVFPAVAVGMAGLVALLHVLAARKTAREEAAAAARADLSDAAGWMAAGPVAGIADGRARVLRLPTGERVAVFRDGLKIGAISNVCAHQNGPLGEGRIMDGCVTCPWHGFQFRLADGVAPPPYTDKVPVHQLRRVGDALELKIAPEPLGATVELITIAPHEAGAETEAAT